MNQGQDQDHDTSQPPPAWLRDRQARGTTTAEALSFFDALPAATIEACTGRWRGSGLHTGHPLDGLLESFGWYGKAVINVDTVHPLLFRSHGGEVYPIDPALMPTAPVLRFPGLLHGQAARLAFTASRRVLRTTRPKARLRMMEYRGVVSATMIYDDLPILDVLRSVDGDTLLGVMDLRGMVRPFFFILRRDAPGSAGGRGFP